MRSLFPILAALLTLLVLGTGGLATTASSLAVPDVLIYATWHRQAGEFLGTAIIGLFGWISLSQPGLRKLARALCIGAAVQGVLGVMPREKGLGPLHSLLAQVLFAGALALMVAASKSYSGPPQMVKDYGWPSLRSLSIVLPALIAIQVCLGVAFRHRLLGLMPHVIGAMLVTIFILIVGSFVLQQCKDHKVLSGAGRLMMVATFVQVFLGLAVFTVRSMQPPVTDAALAMATAHVITGAALLGTSVTLGMHIRRNVTPKDT